MTADWTSSSGDFCARRTALCALVLALGLSGSSMAYADVEVEVDLSPTWLPGVLRGGSSGSGSDYRGEYLRRASQQSAALSFGIIPTLEVVALRLADETRHACQPRLLLEHDEDSSPQGRHTQRERIRELRRINIARRSAPTPALRRRGAALAARIGAVRAVQAHLRCEGLLSDRAEVGVIDARTTNALARWQARVGLVPTANVDADTRAWLALGSEEIDFRLLLRVLRERVAAAADLLADGSATNAAGRVLGRELDPPSWRTRVRASAHPAGLGDRIAPAAERVANRLGWTSVEAARQALQHMPSAIVVPLEERPARGQMRVEIDRGELWYEYPWDPQGRYTERRVQALPTLTLFVQEAGRWRAVVRWPTTVGGWNREQTSEGEVGLEFHDSPVGEVVWRDMIVAPRWLPPGGIPDDALARQVRGRWTLNRRVIGPGPDSAYGLVMLVHHRMDDGVLRDEGIRSHGTGNLPSVIDAHRDSHGCHRMFNHLVLRLGAYLLKNRAVTEQGEVGSQYSRTVHTEDGPLELSVESRGYRFEFAEPIPVNVLEGDIRSEAQTPPVGLHPLPLRRLD